MIDDPWARCRIRERASLFHALWETVGVLTSMLRRQLEVQTGTQGDLRAATVAAAGPAKDPSSSGPSLPYVAHMFSKIHEATNRTLTDQFDRSGNAATL